MCFQSAINNWFRANGASHCGGKLLLLRHPNDQGLWAPDGAKKPILSIYDSFLAVKRTSNRDEGLQNSIREKPVEGEMAGFEFELA